MLNIYVLLPVVTLCVIGVYFSIKEIAAAILRNEIESSIVLEIKENADGVENTVRTAISANPESDIVIIDKSGSKEISAILKHLSDDYECVHIKTPEK